jgi:hypothetical protein
MSRIGFDSIRKVWAKAVGVGLLAVVAVAAVAVTESAGAPPPDKGTSGPVGKVTTQVHTQIKPQTAGQLDWEQSIRFKNDVPVGGSTHLTLKKDGSYIFSGKVHDSGFPSYDTIVVFVVTDSQNRAYTFTHKGYVKGTDKVGLFPPPGARDYTWTIKGKNPAIAQNWAGISPQATFSTRTDLDLGGIIADIQNAIKAAVQVITQVITIVGPALAL